MPRKRSSIKAVSVPPAPVGRAGAAWYSPRVAAMMASIAASSPPAKSPARKRGARASSRMWRAGVSGEATSRPIPPSIPGLRALPHPHQATPAAGFLRPGPPGARGRGAELELHRRCLLRPGRGLEVRLLLEAHHPGEEGRGEALPRGVVLLRLLVEAHALDRDAVLRALELRLEVAEVLVGLQVRIALHDHEQTGERAGQRVLRGLPFREGGGVAGDAATTLRLAHTGAGPGHRLEGRLLEV